MALERAGYDVEVLGGWFNPALKARDQELMAKFKFRFRPLHDLTEQPALRLWLRIRGRLANLIHAKTGCENRWQLGYFVSSLQRAVRHRTADLFIAHSEQALFPLFQLSTFSIQQFRVGVDMEDWFSEDLLPEARKQRPVKLLRSLEAKLLRDGVYTTCPSRAMSEALAKEYGCRPPIVIYNAFPWADRATLDGKIKDRGDRTVPSLHWYSQTLGQGRGLEELFAALPHVRHPLEIHLRGHPVSGFQGWLQERLPENWRSCVFVHNLVSNDELLSRIAEHDIGFAGEQKYALNKELTISNKILHYLLAGLAVVASDTAGQREVAEQADGAVRLYPSGDVGALAARLNEWLENPGSLAAAKAAALRAAENTFCWEHQVPALFQSVKNALAQYKEPCPS